MSEFDLPHVIGQPGNAHCYHIRPCQSIQRAKKEAVPTPERTVEWHDLDLCEYCNDEYEPHNKGQVPGSS